MIVSRLIRLALLSLLPLIALVLYMEGQTYNNALIQFTSSDTRKGIETNFLPAEILGYSRAGQVRIFSHENLYEYVNGHAEYFLSAGFVRLAVGEYVLTDIENSPPDVVVDIFDMGENIQAFGVFAEEVGFDSSTVQIGMFGAKTKQGISFVDGKYYVKITTFRTTIPVDSFARQIEEKITPVSENLNIFSRLPDMGEAIETRFVKEAYRGLDFVSSVIERTYRIEEKKIQVSFVSGNQTDMKKLVKSYLAFFKDSNITYVKNSKKGQEYYKVIDPFEGEWFLIPVSAAVFGLYGEINDNALEQFLKSIKKQHMAPAKSSS